MLSPSCCFCHASKVFRYFLRKQKNCCIHFNRKISLESANRLIFVCLSTSNRIKRNPPFLLNAKQNNYSNTKEIVSQHLTVNSKHVRSTITSNDNNSSQPINTDCHQSKREWFGFCMLISWVRANRVLPKWKWIVKTFAKIIREVPKVKKYDRQRRKSFQRSKKWNFVCHSAPPPPAIKMFYVFTFRLYFPFFVNLLIYSYMVWLLCFVREEEKLGETCYLISNSYKM